MRTFLARQPTLPFKRTKKLLTVKPTPRQKRHIHVGEGPMKGVTTAKGAAPSGNKRKRNSNPGRWQPGGWLMLLIDACDVHQIDE